MTGKLTIIPTPIGNLKDITLRALDALQEAELLLCEDTRHTQILLRHFELRVPLMSYHKFNERERTAEIIQKLRDGMHIGLVSDAGMPGISDPGEILIRSVIEAGVTVEVLPGPSAAITALVGSGLPTTPYLFLGFLSRENRVRNKQLERMAESQETVVFYESPARIRKTVAELLERLGNRNICIGRELTKIHEEYLRSDLSSLVNEPERMKEKGEMVVIVGPSGVKEIPEIDELLKKALEVQPLSKAVRAIAREYDLPKNELYERGLELMREESDGY